MDEQSGEKETQTGQKVKRGGLVTEKGARAREKKKKKKRERERIEKREDTLGDDGEGCRLKM